MSETLNVSRGADDAYLITIPSMQFDAPRYGTSDKTVGGDLA